MRRERRLASYGVPRAQIGAILLARFQANSRVSGCHMAIDRQERRGADECARFRLGYILRLTRIEAATFATRTVALVSCCILLAGCHSQKDTQGPSIEFTKIPPAAQGGRERVDTIAGRVRGARPGQKIVIYAHSGPWWVQPWPDQALIPIKADSTWSTSTHLGFDYAALLVDPGYRPSPTLDVAPTQGGSVISLTIVKGAGTPQLAPTKPLQFSGYQWQVRTIASDWGGLNNLYDGDNAWTDTSGALHLRIKKKAGRWSCADLALTRRLGYGT